MYIITDHLRMMHRLFVLNEPDAGFQPRDTEKQGADEEPGRTLGDTLRMQLPLLRVELPADAPAAGGEIVTTSVQEPAPPAQPDAAAAAGPARRGAVEGSMRGTRRASVRLGPAHDEAALPRNRLLAVLAKIRVQLAVTAAMKNRELRRSIRYGACSAALMRGQA